MRSGKRKYQKYQQGKQTERKKTPANSISIKTQSVNTPPVTTHRDTSEITQIKNEVQPKTNQQKANQDIFS